MGLEKNQVKELSDRELLEKIVSLEEIEKVFDNKIVSLEEIEKVVDDKVVSLRTDMKVMFEGIMDTVNHKEQIAFYQAQVRGGYQQGEKFADVSPHHNGGYKNNPVYLG